MKKTKILALGLIATMLVSGCNIQLSEKDPDNSNKESSNEENSNEKNSNEESSNEENSNEASTRTSTDPDDHEEAEEGPEIEAYREFLRDYYDEEEQDFYATVLKLDEDDQYELAVLIENGLYSYDVNLYIYEDGQVVSLGETFYSCCDDGSFNYFGKENCFYYEYVSGGGDSVKTTEYVYSIQDGELVLEHEFTKETDYETEESTYYVDGEEVDEDTYEDFESEYEAYSNDSFFWLDASCCDYIEDKDDIDEALSTDYEEKYEDYMERNAYTVDKPVIYLYPEEDNTCISAQLDINGSFTCLDPAFNIENGWNVFADRNGDIHLDGKTYDYLFWEAELYANFNFDQGFCVAGDKTQEFLERVLPQLGLNEKETDQFIEYWLPIMEKNPYNVISFQTNEYTDCAGLEITPKPDTMIRVFMAFYASDSFVEMPEQTFTCPEREGFVAVEWGGSYVR